MVETCPHLIFNKHQTSCEDGIYYICRNVDSGRAMFMTRIHPSMYVYGATAASGP
jgi:hypothetical protein